MKRRSFLSLVVGAIFAPFWPKSEPKEPDKDQIIAMLLENQKLMNGTKNPVVLNSGGPVMEAETVEGDQVLCSWNEGGKIARAVFPGVCLSKLVPFADF